MVITIDITFVLGSADNVGESLRFVCSFAVSVATRWSGLIDMRSCNVSILKTLLKSNGKHRSNYEI